MLISNCILKFLGKDSRHTPFVCLVVCIILNNRLVYVGRILWRGFVPFLWSEQRVQIKLWNWYFLCSHAALLPQSLHVLSIGLFFLLSLVMQLSWAPVTFRVVLPRTFPNRPWKKSESTLLGLLLFYYSSCFPQDPEFHSLMVAAAKAAISLHIPDQLFLTCE